MNAKPGICGILCVLSMCFSALAESGGGEQWIFQFAPCARLAGQKGEVATLPGVPSTDIDVDYWDDIADNIKGALFLLNKVRKTRRVGLADIAYTDIEDESASFPVCRHDRAQSRTALKGLKNEDAK